jgi:hypothetical protein
MLSYGARRCARPACASNCEAEMMAAQQAQRMPEPTPEGSMTATPSSSFSPWVVM